MLSNDEVITIIDAVTYQLDPAASESGRPGARINKVPASDSPHTLIMIDSDLGWSAQLRVPNDNLANRDERHVLRLWVDDQVVLAVSYADLERIQVLSYTPGEWEDLFPGSKAA